ncbi:MAG: translation elongation factor Ts, partial [Oscillospiraceae bacterium]
MAFTEIDVKVLRERKNCVLLDCKKALTETNGDMEKAVEVLREKGLAAAAKKAGRIAAEGVVVSVIEGNVGAVLEVNAETDFVAKNASFIEFVNNVAKTIIANNPADVDALLATKMADGQTVEEALRDKILTIGENMKIRRFERLEGSLVSYVHGDGRIGVMVQFATDVASKPEFEEFGRDIAMQIAAVAPQYLCEECVSADVVAKEKEIMLVQIANDEKTKNKPQQVIDKMVEGKIKKFFKEVCLVDQQFVKDGDLTIAQYVDNTAKALGGSIKIEKFVRFEKG